MYRTRTKIEMKIPHVEEFALVVPEFEDDREDKAGDLGTDEFASI